jgi:hypothetical protein
LKHQQNAELRGRDARPTPLAVEVGEVPVPKQARPFPGEEPVEGVPTHVTHQGVVGTEQLALRGAFPEHEDLVEGGYPFNRPSALRMARFRPDL